MKKEYKEPQIKVVAMTSWEPLATDISRDNELNYEDF